ncbi:tropomyosin-2 [Dimargaris xerosporica]|nr:tropomyosin-2 [Dimargaris xerosporica]
MLEIWLDYLDACSKNPAASECDDSATIIPSQVISQSVMTNQDQPMDLDTYDEPTPLNRDTSKTMDNKDESTHEDHTRTSPMLSTPTSQYSGASSASDSTEDTNDQTDKKFMYKKIQILRDERDNATTRAEEAEAALKQMTEVQMERDQEIISYQNKISLLEEQLDAAEAKLKEAKLAAEEDDQHRSAHDGLARKVTMLEEELETRELELKEAREQLRAVDLKAENAERKVKSLEEKINKMEEDYEKLNEKYLDTKSEFDATIKAMDEM